MTPATAAAPVVLFQNIPSRNLAKTPGLNPIPVGTNDQKIGAKHGLIDRKKMIQLIC